MKNRPHALKLFGCPPGLFVSRVRENDEMRRASFHPIFGFRSSGKRKAK
ncbi:MAG: hypothetical protein ACRD3Q_01995 [Terriglobales bacterium]